jgi:hypothetical protein
MKRKLDRRVAESLGYIVITDAYERGTPWLMEKNGVRAILPNYQFDVTAALSLFDGLDMWHTVALEIVGGAPVEYCVTIHKADSNHPTVEVLETNLYKTPSEALCHAWLEWKSQ